MDQGSPGASVSVHEGVNCLELRMRNRGLRDRGQRVGIAERAEIQQQVVDVLVGGWNEGGGAGVVGATANPVLFAAYLATQALKARAGHQSAVDLQQMLARDRLGVTDRLGRPAHRLDVVEHLNRRYVATIITEPQGELC